MLMTVMLLAGSIQFLNMGARAAEETVPEVIISGVKVTENGEATGALTGYLEVSVHVHAKGFQTVGAVLSYDKTVLTPVDWSTAGTPVALKPNSLWTTVVPTKGADNFSGKPALASQPEAGSTPEPPEEAVSDESGLEGPGGTSEEGRGYLYLGAESLQYQDLPAEEDTRLVTVRFRIEKDGDNYKEVTVADAADLTNNEGATLCLAPAAVAEQAVPGAQVQLTCGEEADGPADDELNTDMLNNRVLKYYAWRSTGGYEDNGETECAVSFRLGTGPSINTGSSEPIGGGGNAITFFDWDGRAIDAVSAEADTAAQVVAGWENLHRERLSKPGYAFDRWLVVYENNDGNGLRTVGGTFTSNNAKLDMTDPVVQQDAADLSNLFKNGTSVFLQAAYYATEEVNQGEGVDTSLVSSKTYYTFGDPTFYQYGGVDSANGQYAVRYTVERASAVRAREPVVIAKVYVGSGSNTQYLTVKVDLENTDSTNFEVVVPKATTSIQCQILDAYGASAWIFGTARNDWTNDGNTKIVKNGAFDRLMDEAVAAAANAGHVWNAEINTQCFMDAGYTGVNNSTKLNDAQQKLTAAVISNGGKKLTDAQANAALSGYGSFVRVTP